MIKFETTPSESSISSSNFSSFSDHFFQAAFIRGDKICFNKYRPDDQHFSSRKPSFSGCLNISPRPWDRLKLWWGCFPLMASQYDLPVHVPLEDRNKKFSGQQKREKLEGEVSVVHKMLNRDQKARDYLDWLRHQQDGSALRMPNSLPPKMKELLAELAVVENEIIRLESQINKLKSEAKHHENGVDMESKSKEWEHGTLKNHQESSPDSYIISRSSREKVTFDIKALHFISKAIKGDSNNNEKAMNVSRRFSSSQKENTFHEGVGTYQEKIVLKRSGMLKSPSPLREPRHPTPRRNCGLDIPTDISPKVLSTPLHSEEDSIHRWQPNKLSENIMKCLIFIFVRLLRTSRAMELEKSGPIARFTNFSLSFRAETSSNSKSGLVFQKESRQQDPYGIFDPEESIPRDIGPYKNLVRFTSSSMDPKCIKKSSSVPLFRKLKVLMDGLQKVDLRFLSHQQKLAFWINMYNACIMHGFLQYGVPSVSSPEKLLTLINKATLSIAGNSINAQAIERFILRKPADSPDKEIFAKGEKDTKPMIVHQLYGLETPDPNIAFALCCGTRSSPAVKIYTADGVTAELERSKLEYLQAAIMVTTTKKIAIPELLLRNMHDFADDLDSLMEWLCHQLPTSGSLRKSIVDCFRGLHGGRASAVVEKIPYEFEFQYLLAI